MSDNPHGPMRDMLIDEMIDEDGRREQMNGLDFDMVTTLLACAGEATLGYAMMQVGLLVDGFKDDVGLPVPSIAHDPVHVAVVKLGDFPRRLIYDDLFGWLWYNSEGPEDDPA